MTFNTELAEQLLANLPKAPNISRPRCLCHNKYIEKCPNATPREVELKTEIMNQIAVLDKVKVTDLEPFPHNWKSKCKKRGHKSRGAAEAQMRSLIKRDLINTSKGDMSNINVYRCKRVECRNHPWHVGHNPYVKGGGNG